MSRILFTSMPFAGHIRPGLPIARELVDAGHEVLWYTGQKHAALVAGSGATRSARGCRRPARRWDGCATGCSTPRCVR
jgi:UDP:flavonoid glycosyltransferase YjiC (YdhE family)